MIFKDNNNNIYIGGYRKVFDVLNNKNIDNNELTPLSKGNQLSIKQFIDHQERMLSILHALVDDKVKNSPHLMVRIYRVDDSGNRYHFKNVLIFDSSKLDEIIERYLSGKLYIEFIVFDEEVDLQVLLDFGKFNKVETHIFTFVGSDDTRQLLDSPLITQIYTPSFMKNILHTKG